MTLVTVSAITLLCALSWMVAHGLRFVPRAKVAVIQRFGKVARFADEGPMWLWPGERVAELISLRAIPEQFQIFTRTADDVEVAARVTVMVRAQRHRLELYLAAAHESHERMRQTVEVGAVEALTAMRLADTADSRERLSAALRPAIESLLASEGAQLVGVDVGPVVSAFDPRFPAGSRKQNARPRVSAELLELLAA